MRQLAIGWKIQSWLLFTCRGQNDQFQNLSRDHFALVCKCQMPTCQSISLLWNIIFSVTWLEAPTLALTLTLSLLLFTVFLLCVAYCYKVSWEIGWAMTLLWPLSHWFYVGRGHSWMKLSSFMSWKILVNFHHHLTRVCCQTLLLSYPIHSHKYYGKSQARGWVLYVSACVYSMWELFCVALAFKAQAPSVPFWVW